MFQSTHPHGVRQAHPDCLYRGGQFQSTHPHGVRHSLAVSRHGDIKFQSTHPHGVRPFSRYPPSTSSYVSIHAPTRGATDSHPPSMFSGEFQSTHPHGVRRLRIAKHCNSFFGFNPRTHTGCDAPLNFISIAPFSFNPRTHTGCDDLPYLILIVIHVSIHAPTRGATLIKSVMNEYLDGFNPRTHTGCDRNGTETRTESGRFQSTHPHGVRQCAKLHIISQ